MKYKAVIFDMDGVLVDSEPLYLQEMIDYVRHDLNEPFEYKKIKKDLSIIVGSSEQKTYEILADYLDNKYDPVQLKKEVDARPFELDYRTILNPHVINVLNKLKKEGFRLAIASSSSPEDIERVLTDCNLRDYFEFYISGFDFKESKPHPEIYLTAVEKLGLKPEEVIAIEDSTYGIKACKNANIRVIAMKDDRYGFDQHLADEIATDMFDAMQIIHEWNY